MRFTSTACAAMRFTSATCARTAKLSGVGRLSVAWARAGGSIAYFLTVIEDISARKPAEELISRMMRFLRGRSAVLSPTGARDAEKLSVFA
jgi:hypothetical protein